MSRLSLSIAALTALVLVPPISTLIGEPWVASLPSWYLAGVLITGLGATLLLVWQLPTERWDQPFASPAFLGATLGIVGVVGVLAAIAQERPDLPTGTLLRLATGTGLIGLYIALLVAYVPFLVLGTRWSALVYFIVFVPLAAGPADLVIGSWRVAGIVWIIWETSLLILLQGLTTLWRETRRWTARGLYEAADGPPRIASERSPIVRHFVRLVLLCALGGLLIAFLPVSPTAPLVIHLWDRLPFATRNPLAKTSPQGTPALGYAGIPITHPTVSGATLLAVVTLTAGDLTDALQPGQPLPLLATSYDTFDPTQWTWTQSAYATQATTGALPVPPGAQTVQATVTLFAPIVGADAQGRATIWLPAFEQPVQVLPPTPALAAVSGGGSPDLLSLVGWQAGGPIAAGYRYQTYAALAPPGATGASVPLDPALVARMTQVPSSLAAPLRAYGTAWLAGRAPTAGDLLAAVHAHLRYDPHAVAPAQDDPVLWTLGNARGTDAAITTIATLLLRSFGIPARMATGFLPDPSQAQTSATGATSLPVTTADAALWVQVAVAGVGWQDAFPAGVTSRVPVPTITHAPPAVGIGVSLHPSPTPTLLPTFPAGQSAAARQPVTSPAAPPARVLWLMALLVIGLLALAALLIVLLRRQATLRRLWPLERFLVGVTAEAHRVGMVFAPGATPREASALVGQTIDPAHARDLARLTEVYNRIYDPTFRDRPLTWADLATLFRLIVADLQKRITPHA
jgi:hypothetical protein